MLLLVNTGYASDSGIQYPIDTDADDWKSMSYEEALEKTNIDEAVLEQLSTEEVLELALKYPFLVDIYAFESIEEGIRTVSERSAVLSDFWGREDNAQIILGKLLDISVSQQYLLNTDGYFEYTNLLLFISRECIVEKLSAGEKLQLKEKLLCDAEIIAEMDSDFTIDEKIEAFIDELNAEPTPLLYSTSNGFVGNGCLLYLSNGARYCEGRYYKYGTSALSYLYVSNDWSSTEKSQMDSQTATAHPSWTKLETASRKYNCHAYAWLNESNIWLNDPTNFSNASAYIQSLGVDCAVPGSGSIITIWNSSLQHSAVACNASSGLSKTARLTTTYVISKLGSNGLYRTTLNDVYTLYNGNYYHVYQVR